MGGLRLLIAVMSSGVIEDCSIDCGVQICRRLPLHPGVVARGEEEEESELIDAN